MYIHDVQDFAQTYHPEWDREQGMHMDYSVELEMTLSIDLHSPGLGGEMMICLILYSFQI